MLISYDNTDYDNMWMIHTDFRPCGLFGCVFITFSDSFHSLHCNSFASMNNEHTMNNVDEFDWREHIFLIKKWYIDIAMDISGAYY